MNVSQAMVGAVAALVTAGVGQADAAVVTWVGGDELAWQHSAAWSTGNVPVQGDDVIINHGPVEYWGGGTGGMGANIRNDSTVTVNGGTVNFNVTHWVSVGTGGTGTASALTINAGGTYDMNGGQLGIGNAGSSSEKGTVTVAAGGSLLANNAWIEMQTSGVLNSAGTVSGFGDVHLRDGIINVTGGTFSATTLRLHNDITATLQFNIVGGTVSLNSFSRNDWDIAYVNFGQNLSSLLTLASVAPATAENWLDLGYIRLDGDIDPDSFVVSAFGAGGSQIALVPEPSVAALLGAGLVLISRRRPGASA